jgi:thioredoxin 1
MALLCIGGFCIPYTLLWPFLLLIIKQAWAYIFPQKIVKEIKTEAVTSNKSSLDADHSVSPANFLTASMDFENIIQSDKKTIVRFTATWCKPCKEIEPVFGQLGEEHRDWANFLNIDVDEFEDLSAKYSAFAIPMFLCFKNGDVVNKYTGKDESKLKHFLQECKQL